MKFRKPMQRVGAMLLAFVLTIGGLMVMPPVTAQAAGIQTGAPTLTKDVSVIGFGGHEWVVVGYNGTGVASTSGTMTLLLKSGDTGGGFGSTAYGANSVYEGSTLQQRMEDIYDGAASPFSDVERDMFSAVTLDGIMDAGYDRGATLSEQYIWPLSAGEANALNPEVRKYSSFWWLRSPGYIDTFATCVDSDGYVYNSYGGGGVGGDYGVRPAFKLNLSSVLFTSDAVGGKAGSPGAALSAAQPTTGAVKLTVLDNGLSLASASIDNATKHPGDTVTLTYASAAVGANRYVSCVLLDNAGTIKYYGKLEDISASASGSATIDLPADMPVGDYTLRVFSEECNADYYTDYASTSVDIPLTVEAATTALTVTAPGFTPVTEGYTTRPSAQALTITNSGNTAATINSVAVSEPTKFEIGGTQDTNVAAGGQNTSWTIQPALGLSAGTHSTTVTVTYDTNKTATATASITVNAAAPAASLTMGGMADDTATEGKVYNKTVSVTYTGTAQLSFNATGLPSGLSIDPATGNITGMPAAGTAGSHTVEVTVTDGTLSDTASFTLTIGTPQPARYSVTVSASPQAGGTVSGGGTFDENTSCTVTATANSGYTFVNWTENGAEVSREASYTFTLTADRNLVAHFEATSPAPGSSVPATTDSSTSIPQTGDDSNPLLWLWIAIAAGVLAAVTGVIIWRRKRRSEG